MKLRMIDRLVAVMAAVFGRLAEEAAYTAVISGTGRGLARACQDLSGEILDVELIEDATPAKKRK